MKECKLYYHFFFLDVHIMEYLSQGKIFNFPLFWWTPEAFLLSHCSVGFLLSLAVEKSSLLSLALSFSWSCPWFFVLFWGYLTISFSFGCGGMYMSETSHQFLFTLLASNYRATTLAICRLKIWIWDHSLDCFDGCGHVWVQKLFLAYLIYFNFGLRFC